MGRSFTFEQLQERSKSNFTILSRLTREQKVRRKPRSPQETEILTRIVADRVRKAKEIGELTRVGQSFVIRL